MIFSCIREDTESEETVKWDFGVIKEASILIAQFAVISNEERNLHPICFLCAFFCLDGKGPKFKQFGSLPGGIQPTAPGYRPL